MLSKSAPAQAQKSAEAAADGPVDEIAAEESAHYSKQMGRWRKTTQTCTADPLWWVVAEAMRLSRVPAIHLSDPCHAEMMSLIWQLVLLDFSKLQLLVAIQPRCSCECGGS